jgi:hypothetical protein
MLLRLELTGFQLYARRRFGIRPLYQDAVQEKRICQSGGNK